MTSPMEEIRKEAERILESATYASRTSSSRPYVGDASIDGTVTGIDSAISPSTQG